MAEAFTSYSVDNDRLFREALAKAREQSSDLRIPLGLIARDFFKSQKAIWMLKSEGGYPPLAQSTIDRKERANKPIYPLLKDTGLLEQSMTNPKHPQGVNLIVNKTTLLLGTKVEYGVYHQSDRPRKKIPLRKFLFIGPEARRFATSDQMGRLVRWVKILEDNVLKQLEKLGKVRR
jgi:hypothetical protein